MTSIERMVIETLAIALYDQDPEIDEYEGTRCCWQSLADEQRDIYRGHARAVGTDWNDPFQD